MPLFAFRPMPPGLVGGSGCLGVIGDDPCGMGIGAGRCLVTGWWTGRAGGRDGDGRPGAAGRAAVVGLPDDLGQRLSSRRRGAPAAAGAGRWMRSSRAPGPARSGCGTRRAAGESCAAPTPLIRPRRPGGDRGGSLRPSRPRPWPARPNARDLAALQGSVRRPRPRCGKVLPLRWSCLGALWSRGSDLLSRSHGPWR